MEIATEAFENATVFIVDDDAALAESLRNLLFAAGFRVEAFTSPQAFARGWSPKRAGCLLLDVRFPGANGLDFQDELLAGAIGLPVILMTAHADVRTSVRGLKAGAIDFLLKPFDQDDLFKAVRIALAYDHDRRASDALTDSLNARLVTLTKREREVFELVVLGMLNKQMAAELNLSEITVKVHRSRVMRKMEAASIPDLVRIHAQLTAPNGPAGNHATPRQRPPRPAPALADLGFLGR